MIYCPGCGTANREGSRYCNKCGTRLTEEDVAPCPRCGRANPPEAIHCQECGLDLLHPRTDRGLEAGPESPARLQEGQEDGLAAGEPAEQRALGLPPWLDSVERPELEAEPGRGRPEAAEPEDEDLYERPRPEWSADALPIEPSVGVPYRARERSELPPTPEEEAARDLFAEAAAEEVHASPATAAAVQGSAAPRQRGLGPGWQLLIPLVLLAAILVPLIWPFNALSSVGPAPAGVAEAAKAIAELPRGATVLVAFEYDAGLAGEMQPIAEAYLQQLLGQGLQVVTVSTQPEGAALAEMALDRALAAHTGAEYGKSVLNLGYAAGGEAAVRALATDLGIAPADGRGGQPPRSYPILEGVGGARDLALIVVLGRDLLAVQRWIEQVGMPYGVGIAAGVPALGEPALEPYWKAGQLRGMVAGLRGAAAYERLEGRPAAAGRMLGGLRAGVWAAGGLVALGNLIELIGRWRRRRG